MNKYPQLETERLILRSLTMDDLEFAFQHFGDPMINRYLLDGEPVTRREQAVELINFYLEPTSDTYNRWGIVLKEEGVLVGTCGFHKWERRYFRAEIGYDLGHAYWGQGIMSEALREALSFGFDHMELNRVDALVYPENTLSIRILERLGFRQEGVLRDYFYAGGEFYDHLLFSLLKREWA